MQRAERPASYFGAVVLAAGAAFIAEAFFFMGFLVVILPVDMVLDILFAAIVFCAIAGAATSAAMIATDARSLLVMRLALLLAAKRGCRQDRPITGSRARRRQPKSL